MKRVKLEITMNVPDDFLPGNCRSCPISKKESYEDGARMYCETISCKLGYPKELCPIEDNNFANKAYACVPKRL